MRYLESDLEDWAEQSLAKALHPEAMCAGRQVTLPSGRRLDLLFYHKHDGVHNLTVVEMKTGDVGATAVAQLADYMDEIEAGRIPNCSVFGILVSDGFLDYDADVLVRRLPRVGYIQLKPRVSCEVWYRRHHDMEEGTPERDRLRLFTMAGCDLRGAGHEDHIRGVLAAHMEPRVAIGTVEVESA